MYNTFRNLCTGKSELQEVPSLVSNHLTTVDNVQHGQLNIDQQMFNSQ